MAVGISSLSSVCRQLGQIVTAGVNSPASSRISVVIGTPAAAATVEGDQEHRLNLFFFRFEPSGFFPDGLPGENWLVRAHCLITPFCIDEDTIAAGENDLRTIGEVLRLFHEQPVFLMTVDGEQFQIQVVFITLGLDQLNQLWSTQGDTVYRPSALFEVSLAPVMPREAAVPAPRVGSVGFGIRATMAVRHALPAAADLGLFVPQVVRSEPDTRVEAWVPALCIVAGETCLRSVSLALGSPALAGFDPAAWVAGRAGAEVGLHWEVWDAALGWRPFGAPDIFDLVDTRIDPAAAATAATRAIELPFTDHAGQMLLYAQRSFERADGVRASVRSDPVLITLFEAN